jgi:hypothetical protein
MNEKKKILIIKSAYWLGIAADALWAVALFVPHVFGLLLGNANFDPDLQVRLIMGIGGSLMTGWTFLLLWAVKEPIERRMVILLTAFPVVFGMFVIAMIGLLGGNTSNIWLLIKTSVLMISMISSFILSAKKNDLKKDKGSSKKRFF